MEYEAADRLPNEAVSIDKLIARLTDPVRYQVEFIMTWFSFT